MSKRKLLILLPLALVLTGCVDLSWLQSGEIEITEVAWAQAALCLAGILVTIAVPAAIIAVLAALMDE